jgi:hypothetical protein
MKSPNNEKYMLMFLCVIYIFYNMIQDFFYLCILIHCASVFLPQSTFVSLQIEIYQVKLIDKQLIITFLTFEVIKSNE